MCKHGNVFSLPLLTDEHLTIGILRSINAKTNEFYIAFIYQSSMRHTCLPAVWRSPGDYIEKVHLFPYRTQ